MAISPEQKEKAENQINASSKVYEYYTVEWDLRSIYNRYSEWLDDFDNELFVPPYQRNETWTKTLKSRFIESLLLNLPIPYLFLNESWEYSKNNVYQRLEIVDWSQRIRTIVAFMNDEFRLTELKYLNELSGFRFSDLPIVRQKKFDRIPLRILVFKYLDKDQKKEIFNRINTTSDLLKPMEVRKWSYAGRFYDLLAHLARLPQFVELCPLTDKKLDREEDVELVLRYFAYTEKYSEYHEKVQKFLDDYISERTSYFEDIAESNPERYEFEVQDYTKRFTDMLKFVKRHFPNWFRKKGNVTAASRAYYEAVAVWVGLALADGGANGTYKTEWIQEFVTSTGFLKIVSSDAANFKAKFLERTSAIRDYLLTP